MEQICSRKNKYIVHLRKLASDSGYRKFCSEFVCEGIKTLNEAISFGAEITSVLWKSDAPEAADYSVVSAAQYMVPDELFDYASPLESCPGPVFTVKMRSCFPEKADKVIILENLQDPGNVGTVLRTARAFGIDLILLLGNCADVYNFKTVRASMGAIFSQDVMISSYDETLQYLKTHGLPLYGASLSDRSVSIGDVSLSRCAVAVGNEGKGLSDKLLNLCDKEIIIPMCPESESLNAAVAASVIMWEMYKA